MSIKRISTIILLLLAFGLSAQSDLSILLMEKSGGIKYAADAQTKPQKLNNNNVLSVDGRLKLNAKGKVILYCNGVYQTLEGKGLYLLNEAFKDAKETEPSEFTKLFNNYLAAAAGKAVFGKKQPKDKAPIAAISPVAGTLATFSIPFYWRMDDEAADLKLELLDAEGKTIHTVEVSGGEATIDPRKARLFPGRAFSWRVFSEANPELSSKPKTFQMSTIGQKDLVLSALKEEKRYQEAKPDLQMLMEAAFWESKEWYSAADGLYRQLSKEAPENQLYQQLYKAFLLRCGLD